MRILILAQFYPPDIGGEERHARNLAIGLQGRGHEVHVITTHLPGTPVGNAIEDGVRVRRVVSSAQRIPFLHGSGDRPHAMPVADPAMRSAIDDALATGCFDVVHAHNWIVNSALAPAHHRDVPVVLTLHDYSHRCAVKRYMRDGSPCDGPGVGQCLRCSATHYGAAMGPMVAALNGVQRLVRERRVDYFVPVSRSVAVKNGLPGARVTYEVIPNFIPDDLVVQRVPIAPEAPILYLGDLVPDKGAQVLVEAHARIEGAPPLHLVGRPSPYAPIASSANVVVFPPRAHDAAMTLMRTARVVVVPSLVPDSCPTVVLEAMAAGRPVIASATGGIVDMIDDNKSGLLVEPGDVEGLARAISRLLGDADLAEQLGVQGQQAVTSFTASAVLARLEDLYGRLAKRHLVTVF